MGTEVVINETARKGARRWVVRGVDRKANTLGRGALEVGDHRLLEDGSER